MMNLDLLFYVASNTEDKAMWDAAVQHARTTQRTHLRTDHSSIHLVVLDPADGSILQRLTNQGYDDDDQHSDGQHYDDDDQRVDQDQGYVDDDHRYAENNFGDQDEDSHGDEEDNSRNAERQRREPAGRKKASKVCWP